MRVKEMVISQISFNAADNFCQRWHYSHGCPPSIKYYGLWSGIQLIGVCVYGNPAMRFQSDCYDVDIELRRLACIDDTPVNTESYFIGATLKLIAAEGYKKVLSLADPKYGHSGTIYRASNFRYEGVERGGGSRDIFIDGEHYHSRTAFAKFGASGKIKLEALFPNSVVEVVNKERKYVYTYCLNKRERREYDKTLKRFCSKRKKHA